VWSRLAAKLLWKSAMERVFSVGEESAHVIGHRDCPECWEDYPVLCACGGLIHAAGEDEDAEGMELPAITLCDRCGRSEEEIE
jgi:hypothetical protein